jgi:hypothetical protein
MSPGSECFHLGGAGDRESVSVRIRSDAVRSAGKRVAVLYEPGRAGLAALDLAGRLAADESSVLTVVSVAPQDTRICCGAGSAIDYNQAVREAVGAELQRARELLGDAGDRASFKLLVQDTDPPLAAWIDATGFDIVLLPARRRPLRSAKHPAADQLVRLTSAEIRVVDAPTTVNAGVGPAPGRGAASGVSGHGAATSPAGGAAGPGA